MQQLGIYEQLITQLISARLNRDKFYVGERELHASDASVWISRFLTKILEHAISSVPSGEGQLQEQIELSNQLFHWQSQNSARPEIGRVTYVSHTGSQPMSITWQLTTPMPPFMWHQAAKLAVG